MNREGIIDPGSPVARSSIAGYSCDTWHTLLTPTTTLKLQVTASIFPLPFVSSPKDTEQKGRNPTLSSHNCGNIIFQPQLCFPIPRRHFSQTVIIMLWKLLPGRVENATGANERRRTVLGAHMAHTNGSAIEVIGNKKKKVEAKKGPIF